MRKIKEIRKENCGDLNKKKKGRTDSASIVSSGATENKKILLELTKAPATTQQQ